MAYAAAAKFVALFGEAEARLLAPTTPASTGYDQAKIDLALTNASNFADTYLASRYPTPLNPVPDVVGDAVCDLAREALDRNGRAYVVQAADRRRAWFRDLSLGKATLGVAAGSEADPGANAPAAGGPVVDAPARVFDDVGLDAFLRG
ncbi:phage protein Gp36 family protein [Caulobacter segnis]|uniref:DUF1320 domain-containing protein n=1 Tax=Caulobacter segnis TaxID=88688 RepID=A0A2W5UWZ8_9CAUL|nr:phage protein Gp36 family protein [Caulobacter segnis]PZR32289.1 MAG: DUF1320 domain-containing protein [Caulobacter segnis]